MDERKNKRTDKILRIWMLLLVVGMLAYLLYMALVKKAIGSEYPFVVVAFLSLLWLVSDVLPIILKHSFDGKTEEQKKAYLLYALCNLVGYAGLGYFALAYNQNTGMYGALAYVVMTMFRRRFLDTYKGTEQEDAHEEKSVEPVFGEEETALTDQAAPEEAKGQIDDSGFDDK